MAATAVEAKRVDVIEPISAMAVLPPNLALIKMENESIFSMAAARPRDHAAILADLKHQMSTYRTFAEDVIYNKPVGKDQNGQMKYARGLSIRAAEAIAASYGYNRCRVDVTPIDDDTVRIEATFTDYQTGRVFQDGGVVSKFYKGYGGVRKRWDDDRFHNVVLKAEGSRRLRECILRCVPPGLKSDLEEMAESMVAGFLDEKTASQIITKFADKNVTQEQLERLIGKKLAAWNKDDLVKLRGAFNALKDNETTVAELFGGEESNPNGQPRSGNDRVAQTLGVASEKLTKDLQESVAAVNDPAGDAYVKAIEDKRADVLRRYEEMSKPIRDVFHGAIGFTDVAAAVAEMNDPAELDRIIAHAVNVTRKPGNGKK